VPGAERDDASRRQEVRYRRIVESTLDSLVISRLDGTILEANDVAHAMYGYAPGDFVGRNLFDVVDPEWQEPAAQLIQDVSSGQVVTFTGICRRPDGERLWIEGRATLLEEDGETRILSMARSITDRVRTFEILDNLVQERTRELTTLLDVTRTIGSTLDLETLMSVVLDAVQRLIGYDGASLSVVDGEDLVIVVGRPGYGQDRPATRRISLSERSAIWHLVARGDPVVIDDVLGDSPLARTYQHAAALAGFSSDMSFCSWMGMPVILRNEVVGILSMVHRTRDFFTQQHVDLVGGVTRQLAVSIDNVRLYARAQKAAVLEERQRLSRELHDSVSQVLYSVALGSKTARALIDRDVPQAAHALDFTIAQAERGLSEMRALIFELRPESLEQEGLLAALQRQIAALTARYNVPVTLLATDEPQVDLAVKEALYRIGQEALHNTFKHAGASAVQVALHESESEVSLEVRDDGKGTDEVVEVPGHLGLRSMRERAQRLGGDPSIQSGTGTGTTVMVTLPRSWGRAAES
jgi:PAS domain S-box-containing protein